MPGMHQVAAPSSALGRGSFMLLIQLFLSHTIYMVVYTAHGAWHRVTQAFCLLCMVARGPLFQVVFHPISCLPMNLWQALNLVIPVRWLGIRLVNYLHVGGGVLYCLIMHLPWFHRQGVNFNPLPT